MTGPMNDMLTVAKNIVTAINDQARQTLLIAGSQVVTGVSVGQQVAAGSGRVANVSVTVAGSAVGSIHDTAVYANANTSNQLYVIPAAVGLYAVNLPYNLGLIVKPGTGQTVAVSYSIGNIARGGQ